MISKICLECDNKFSVQNYRKDSAKFCCKKCFNSYLVGRPHNHKTSDGKNWNLTTETKLKIGAANKGKKRSKEFRQHLSKVSKGTRTGASNPSWKGSQAKYSAIHMWVSKYKGTPKRCELCGDESKKRYEWANTDHKYRRDLNDYIRLCVKCHKEYDKTYAFSPQCK